LEGRGHEVIIFVIYRGFFFFLRRTGTLKKEERLKRDWEGEKGRWVS